MDEEGKQYITAIPAHQVQLQILIEAVISCTAGKYIRFGVCTTCGIGKYAQSSGSSSCTDCQNGQYQDQAEATEYSCKTCGLGQFASDAQTACTNCPAGYKQSKSENVPFRVKSVKHLKFLQVMAEIILLILFRW